ncbi:hypothetical protein TGAM01_v201759 [Trichoderma gamsii]|uniref:J domain-containing protein n=1 Tax=Trichoderma gamsii TaxID=398673 RepID=A0A2P4ZYZ0_9HYPO|nr:hypothetical protein TGAM01_v201759 [Trichoderma gamsii]PON29510.1 hypothetical protein TGAM01_v201759 [Trichoderma gamsii]
MAPQRNYYADLELPMTADVTEIKKQFRKLALKYHPDRNPGREQEVNSQFQIIQAAHEVLSDPDAKAKYDASFARSAASRYPASSGVRGNPWQNVSQQYPTPPRRGQPRTATSGPQNGTRGTSGAQRWNERFSAGVPPTAKQQPAPATAARAFESMRKGGAKNAQQDRPVPPPPPPPRTESAKKRAEASFGAKKAGYYPRSNTPGDEPPVTNNNYYSSRMNAERAAEPVPDPLAQFREKSRTEESFMDPPQSSPYTKDGSEKSDPSDSSPINRAKSAKVPSRKEPRSEPASPPTPKRRSPSMPRKESTGGAQRSQFETGADERPRAVPVPPSSRPNSRPSSSYKVPSEPAAAPNDNSFAANHLSNMFTVNELNQTPSNHTPFNKPATPVNGVKDPSMYAIPQKDKPGGSSLHHGKKSTNQLKMTPPPNQHIAEVGSKPRIEICVPSGMHVTVHNLSPFEQKQNAILKRLIKNQRGAILAQANKPPHRTIINHKKSSTKESNANNGLPSSFNFSLDDDTFVPDAPGTAQFRKSTSVDGINTNFVKDNTSTTWQFSAGSGDNDSLPQSRSRSTNKADRCSPIRRRPVATPKAPNFGTQSTQNSTRFDPEQYKFEPQMFAPRPGTPSKPGSPTRKTGKKVPRTPIPMSKDSTAAMPEDNSNDDHPAGRGRNAQPKATTVGSPQAMDIDSPLTASPSATPISTPPPLVPTTPSVTSTPIPVPAPIVPPHTHHQHHSPVARNIHVEPSRPEWRPGNVTGLGQAQRQSEERKEIPINFKGSEDSEEFRATFEDFKNVAPFAPPKPGLKSFTELKDNLPFESQASAELHLNNPSQPQQLELPDPPLAPGLPLIVEGAKPSVPVWTKYLEEFEGYLRRWDIFNSQVVDHFATRKANISNARVSKGYSFLGVRGDTDVSEYYNWVEQDNGVRRIWLAACEEHETRFREFMAFREKMKMPI